MKTNLDCWVSYQNHPMKLSEAIEAIWIRLTFQLSDWIYILQTDGWHKVKHLKNVGAYISKHVEYWWEKQAKPFP